MDPFSVRLSQSLLAINEWLRRSPPEVVHGTVVPVPALPDAWADFVLQARIFIEHTEGRTLILFRLIHDIAPELVSRATALRYVRQLERKSLIAIEAKGRHQIVNPTEAFLESWRIRARTIRSILDGFGIVDRPQHREGFVLHLSANGVVQDAWNTKDPLGYAPVELLGRRLENLIPYAPEDTRDLLEDTVRRASKGELVRKRIPLSTKAAQLLDAEMRAVMERTSTGTDILRAEFLIPEREA